jgi:hypothetical protein
VLGKKEIATQQACLSDFRSRIYLSRQSTLLSVPIKEELIVLTNK